MTTTTKIPKWVPEAWEIEDMERARRVRDAEEREMNRIPYAQVWDGREINELPEERS